MTIPQKIKLSISFFLIFLVVQIQAQDENSAFSILDTKSITQIISDTLYFKLDKQNLYKTFNIDTDIQVVLPTINKNYRNYTLKETHVVDDKVSDSYDVRTFVGRSLEDSNYSIVCDITPQRANFLYSFGDQYYILAPFENQKGIYYLTSVKDDERYNVYCGVDESIIKNSPRVKNEGLRNPILKTTYDIAFSVAGEYAQEFGGYNYNVTNVLNSIAAGVNLMNQTFKREIGVEFNIVSDERSIWYNPSSDPFNPNDLNSIIDLNTNLLDSIYGSNSYDIGHAILWSNKGGVAYLNSVCNSDYKGGGTTAIIGNMNKFWLQFAAHEIGHQLGSHHKFAAAECFHSTNNNRYEPGSGTSIMSYAGICEGASNTPKYYFHYSSIAQMRDYISSQTCGITTGGNDSAPLVNAGQDITIPKNTPFYLVGAQSNALRQNNLEIYPNTITYNWIQYDGSGPETNGMPDCSSTTDPLFKYTVPSENNYRYFPSYAYTITGHNDVPFEKLPCTPRQLNFKLVARDNDFNYGRISSDDIIVTVADTGPFTVLTPNGNEVYNQNQGIDVIWSVNGTDSHCPMVDILYSIDNGLNYSVIESSVQNDGHHNINLDIEPTLEGRILVQCSTGGFQNSSTFYDVSDASFEVGQSLPIEYLYFNGKSKSKTIQLHWATALEENSDYFTVEKYLYGEWIDLAEIESGQKEYLFNDFEPMHGENIYRLKNTDLDNTISYSKTINVPYIHSKNDLILFPVPFDTYINVGGVTDEVDYILMNNVGQIIKQGRSEDHRIISSDLASGIYYVILSHGDNDYHFKINKR